MKYISIILLMLAACSQTSEHHPANCHMQSPVNIVPSDGVGSSHQVLVHYKTSKERVLNLGHTIELEYDSGSYITYDGIDYQFRQLHFHTPSEHMLNNQHLSMEMHIVHVNLSQGKENPQYLVVAVFFKKGKENAFLKSFLDAVPKQKGEIFESDTRIINASDMIPSELHDYYHYYGSLTTPPYTEAVNWIILKEQREASKEQIDLIHGFEGDNARNVQLLYDRVIESVN